MIKVCTIFRINIIIAVKLPFIMGPTNQPHAGLEPDPVLYTTKLSKMNFQNGNS